MSMNRTLVAALAAAFALPAQADDAVVSKNAGICTAYKQAAKDDRVAEQALRTAANRQLATNYGRDWARRARIYGMSSKGAIDPVFAFEGASACRKIGIR